MIWYYDQRNFKLVICYICFTFYHLFYGVKYGLYLYEVKRRCRVLGLISSQSPIVFIQMQSIDWLEIYFGQWGADLGQPINWEDQTVIGWKW